MHEIGHALSASFLNKNCTYAISPNRNPSVKITTEMNNVEYVFIASSGFAFTSLAFFIMVPLFDGWFEYLFLSSFMAFGDFRAIYNKILKANEKVVR